MVISKLVQNIKNSPRNLWTCSWPPDYIFSLWLLLKSEVISRFYKTRRSFYGAVHPFWIKTRDTAFRIVGHMSHFWKYYKIFLKESIGFLYKRLKIHRNFGKIGFSFNFMFLHDYLELVGRSKYETNHKIYSLLILQLKSTVGLFFLRKNQGFQSCTPSTIESDFLYFLWKPRVWRTESNAWSWILLRIKQTTA